MRRGLYLFVAVVLLWGVQENLFSQFTLKSIVEISISYEDYSSSFMPNAIQLVGNGKIFGVVIDKIKDRYYAEVEPGEYFVSVDLQSGQDSRSVMSQMDIFFLFDPVSQAMVKEGQMTNQIKIREKCNFILDIVFKTRSSLGGFERIEDKSLDDFDYCKLFFFTASEMDLNGGDTIASEQKNEYRAFTGPSSMESAFFQTQDPTQIGPAWECTAEEAGENSQEYITDVNRDFILDDGNINAHLGRFILKNCGYHRNLTSGQGYGGLVGTRDSNGRWVCAHVPIIHFEPRVLDSSTTICDPGIKKCVSKIDLDLYVKIAVYSWNQDEMCRALQGYQLSCWKTKNGHTEHPVVPLIDINNPQNISVYCPIFYAAVQEHEQCHIDAWRQEISSLVTQFRRMTQKEILAFFNDPKAICCKKDDECKDELKELKKVITSPFAKKLGTIFTQARGDAQENSCYRREEVYLRTRVRRDFCD